MWQKDKKIERMSYLFECVIFGEKVNLDFKI